MTRGRWMTEDIPLSHQYYCTECKEVIGQLPKRHRNEVHDGKDGEKILPIKRSRGEWVAESETMRHFRSHIWMTVGSEKACIQCGAVKVADDDRSSPNGSHQYGVYE